ncbi:unnamed protein product [Aureobasidium uvarum]|uniref:HMA domain-containing protein n=1 Tax=Aureobasidium uvarum TaxID=2773716 RepID=A0A9N8KBC8_9PEZI|nr:unnamed protein product [Aureobasidium uvarum]
MSDHTYNFNITMTCGGCSGAVERVLKKLDVITEPTLDYTTVLEKIKKTGKKVNSAEADGQPQAV